MWSRNRFGQEQAIVGLKDKKNNGYPYGYLEIKGVVYKVTTSVAKKDGVDCWVTLTKTDFKPMNRRY